MISEEKLRELLIKKTRRELLMTLKAFYPSSADFETICLVLPTVEQRYLKIDLSYLIDKGYVEWVNKLPNASWAEREFKLTAEGVETADRINRDPAIEQ